MCISLSNTKSGSRQIFIIGNEYLVDLCSNYIDIRLNKLKCYVIYTQYTLWTRKARFSSIVKEDFFRLVCLYCQFECTETYFRFKLFHYLYQNIFLLF